MGIRTASLHTETQGISIVETQGILSGEKQRTDRVYNFYQDKVVCGENRQVTDKFLIIY